MIPHISGALYRGSPNDSSVLLTKIQHISQIFKINGFDLDFSVEYCNIDSAQHLVCDYYLNTIYGGI